MTVLYKEVFGLGKPVVMLHGWAMHTGVWRTFAQALAENSQVVCLDLPGHGLSDNIEPYTLESLVDEIAKELPEQTCTLVGWSLGGNIALRLAEKYPQRIKSLVLLASNPAFLKTESWPGVEHQVLDEFTTNLQKDSAQTLLRFMSLQVKGRPDAKSSIKKIKMAMQECDLPTPEVLLSALGILQATDQRTALSRLNLPVMMILGEQDTLMPVLVGEHCKVIQPRLDLKIITDAGHAPFITHQQQLVTYIQDFMQRSDV